ncbi:GroES-like protein [Penicillium chermesinum]|nr:GroES-like protein [Penicillium chermesinum]
MSSTTYIPRIHRALVAPGPGSIALKPIPVPPIADDQVLVRVAAVALNPSDYKLLDQSTTLGAVSGSDFAGTVVRVSSSVSHRVKVGDRICGFVFGANPGCPENGAWGQYEAATLDLCMPIPPEMDFATAASLAMGTATAGLAFRSLGLKWDGLAVDSAAQKSASDSSANEDTGKFVLVYGGATATGTLLLQFLRMAGYAPLTTCSAANFDMVIGRGALHAFDYNAPTCVDDIRTYTGERLAYVLDCIVQSAIRGGRYSALELYPRLLTIRRRDVVHDWILGWTLFGAEVQLAGAYHRPPMPEDWAFGKQWAEMVSQLIADGRLQAHPLEIVSGHLSMVIPSLDRLREGKMRGRKVVVQVQA